MKSRRLVVIETLLGERIAEGANHTDRAVCYATAMRKIAAVCLLLLIATAAAADAIDTYLRAEMANQRIPGVAVAVLRDGKPISVRTLGVANIELGTPVTRDTVFKIGSVSKQFIATGIMLLVRDGNVRLDEPVKTYLDDVPAAWSGITLRHLLTHTSGLVRESPAFDGLKAQSDADLIRAAYDVPLQSAPGEKWSYSNLAYFTLAEVIRRVSGQPWPQFMSERVFEPLGMTATRTTDALAIVPNRANGYLFRDDVLHNVEPMLALRPSGAFLSSLTDLMKYEAALRDDALLSKAEQAQMLTPMLLTDGSSTNYGLGWNVEDFRGHRRVRHGGSLPGFRADFSRYDDDSLAVIVLVNADGVRTDALSLEVANHYIRGLSPDRPIVKLPVATLQEYAGRYQLDVSNSITVGVDGPGLSLQFSEGGPQVRVLPENATTFFSAKDENYVFTKENDKVTQLAIRNGGSETLATRIDPAQQAAIEQRIARIESDLLPNVLVKGEARQPVKLADQMRDLHVPAVSIAVINDGRIEWARAYGVTRIGGPAATPDTLFQAASISKPVSALAVMQLVQEGKLNLDADVNEYLRSWRVPASDLTKTQKVTLRRLLSHSAGMTVHGFAGYAAGEKVPTLVEVLNGTAPANSAPIRVDIVPGTQFRYSGGGYEVMQQLVEDVTQQPFAQLMSSRVLGPLGMSNGTFQQPLPASSLSNVATPYDSDGKPIAGGPHVYPEQAAAGLWTTPSDLARYVIGVQKAAAGGSGAILSPDSVRTMLTKVIAEQGVGPQLGGTAPHLYFMHGGANEGYRCVMVGYVDGDGAVVMTSGDEGGRIMSAVVRSIAAAYDWPDFAPPERVLTKVDPGTFDRYVGAYRFDDGGPTMTVWRDGEHLYSHVREAPITELFATSEHEYFQRARPARLEFLPDAMILHESNDAHRPARRMAAAESKPLVEAAVAAGRRLREQRPASAGEAMVRRVISSVASGKPDYTAMTADQAKELRDSLAEMRTTLDALGTLNAIRFQKVLESGSDYYIVDFDKGAADVAIELAKDGRISAFWMGRR
jgi:CubicO group peptidase (beta-lactamase class C family)